MKSPIRRVKRDVAMNPVARAVARAVAQNALARSIVDAQIAMYMLKDGEPCMDILAPMPVMVRAMLLALKGDQTSVDYRKLLSADGVADEMAERGTWRSADVVTLSGALDIVLRRWPALPPKEASEALRFAMKEKTA